MDVAAPPPHSFLLFLVLLLLQEVDVIVTNISSAGRARARSDMNQGKCSVRESQDIRIVSPDWESHVREGVGPGHVGTHGMLDPAVGPPVTETAVVCHPRDEQVEGVGLPDYVRPPGGEARFLSVALREADRQLLQD